MMSCLFLRSQIIPAASAMNYCAGWGRDYLLLSDEIRRYLLASRVGGKPGWRVESGDAALMFERNRAVQTLFGHFVLSVLGK